LILIPIFSIIDIKLKHLPYILALCGTCYEDLSMLIL
jgi:hypothetical protein